MAAVVALTIGELVELAGPGRTLLLMSVSGGLALLDFLLIDSLTAYYLCGIVLGAAGSGVLVPVKVWMSQRFDFA